MLKAMKLIAILVVTLACLFAAVEFLIGPGLSRYRPSRARRYPVKSAPKLDVQKKSDPTDSSRPTGKFQETELANQRDS